MTDAFTGKAALIRALDAARREEFADVPNEDEIPLSFSAGFCERVSKIACRRSSAWHRVINTGAKKAAAIAAIVAVAFSMLMTVKAIREPVVEFFAATGEKIASIFVKKNEDTPESEPTQTEEPPLGDTETAPDVTPPVKTSPSETESGKETETVAETEKITKDTAPVTENVAKDYSGLTEQERNDMIANEITKDLSIDVTGDIDTVSWWSYDENKKVLVIEGSGDMENVYGETPWRDVRKQVETIVIKPGITSVPDYAFNVYPSLVEVYLPATVKSIGKNAFSRCDNLRSVNIPDGVEIIGDKAFYNDVSLGSISLPDSAVSIGAYAFWNCTSLKTVTLSDSTANIGEGAFENCTALEDITSPTNLRSLGVSAFEKCRSLKRFDLYERLSSLGEYAFFECTELEEIIIPGSIKTVPKSAFYNSGIKRLIVSDGTESVGRCSFGNCKRLESIALPDSLLRIERSAFSGCESLVSVRIPDSVVFMDVCAFANCLSLELVHTGSGLSDIPNSAFSECYSLKEAYISEGTETISHYAFGSCDNLEKIYIPSTILKINFSAITAKQIHVDFNGSEQYWNDHNFGSAWFKESNGATITFLKTSPEEDPPAEMITGSFGVLNWTINKGDGTLTISNNGTPPSSYEDEAVYFRKYARLIKKVVVEDGVTRIVDNEFYDCVLITSVSLPSSVRSIGEDAFCGCNSLDTVYLRGLDRPGFDQIMIGEGNDPLLNAELVFEE